MSKRLLLLLLVIAIVATGLVGLRALLGSGDMPDSLTSHAIGHAEPPAGEHTPATLDEPDVDPTPALEANSTDVPTRSSAAAVDEVGEPDLIELSGRVLFPDGAPPDPTLVVVARTPRGDKFNSDSGFQGMDDFFASATGPSEARARAQVSPTGAFIIEMPADGGLMLELDGRYLYSEPVAVPTAPDSDGDSDGDIAVLEITGELGAWVTGTCTAPVGIPLADTGLLEAKAQLRGFSMSGGSRGFVLRPAPVQEDLTFEIRGIPTDRVYTLSLDPGKLATENIPFFQVTPGQKRDVEFQFKVGATVHGHVQDEAGVGLAGVEVRVAERTGFGAFSSAKRIATTAADGSFSLSGISPGERSLRAEPKNRMPASVSLEELVDREVRENVLLVSPTGLTLSGKVVFADGAPAAGAEVHFSFSGSGLGRRTTSGNNHETTTDEEGLFRLAGLAEDTKGTVHASAMAAADDDETIWHVQEKPVSPGPDELLLTLAPPLSVTGRVVDDTGAPLSQYALKVEASPNPFDIAQTDLEVDDTEGRFEVSLPAGHFSFEIEAEGYVTTKHVTDIPASELEIEVPRAASITGIVLDPAGRPVPKANVEVVTERNFGASGGAATTDEDGRFVLEDLDPGITKLKAEAEGFAPSEEHSIQVGPGAVSDELELFLREPGRIVGVIYGSLGEPESGRKISLMKDMSSWGSGDNDTSDLAGRFEFVDLAEGQFTLMAQPNMENMFSSGNNDGRTDAQRQAEMFSQLKMTTVDVVAGQTTEVVLGEQPTEPVVITGRVTSAGEPVADVVVLALAEGEGLLSKMKPAATDEDGRYELTLSAPGLYVFTLNGSNIRDGITFDETIPSEPRYTVDLALPGGRIEGHVLAPDGSPVESVRIGASPQTGGAGLAMLDGMQRVTTEDDGFFAIEFLRAGTYRLRASGGKGSFGRTVVSDIVVEKDSSTLGVEIRLAAAAELEGIVRDAAGEGIEADIFLRNAAGVLIDEMTRVRSGADGNFTVDDLAPGLYSVCARTKEAATTEVQVDVLEASASKVELDLTPSSYLEVTLVDEEDEPLRATFEVLDMDGRQVQRMIGSNAMQVAFTEGFSSTVRRIGPLPLGRYRVKATMPDGRKAKRTKTLRAGKQLHKLKLRLK